MKPGSVSSADRAPPPIVSFASNTTTLHPACASTIAALNPFGPEPITTASIMCRIRIPRPMPEYWYSRWLFERSLAAIYLCAFFAAAVQFVPLLGERGLEPVGRWLQQVPFRSSPSLFYLLPRDPAFRTCTWLGVALSVVALSSLPQRLGPWPAAAVWAGWWVLYLSLVNIGQTFSGFGWE